MPPPRFLSIKQEHSKRTSLVPIMYGATQKMQAGKLSEAMLRRRKQNAKCKSGYAFNQEGPHKHETKQNTPVLTPQYPSDAFPLTFSSTFGKGAKLGFGGVAAASIPDWKGGSGIFGLGARLVIGGRTGVFEIFRCGFIGALLGLFARGGN
jgi:hypothetical protein